MRSHADTNGSRPHLAFRVAVFLVLCLAGLHVALSGRASAQEFPCPAKHDQRIAGAQTSCLRLTVGMGTEARTVFLRIIRPEKSNGIAVLFGSGGTGAEFFPMRRYQPNTAEPFAKLIDAGYTILSRSWVDGWFGSGRDAGRGVGELSSRYKELTERIRTGAGFSKLCSVGVSGGAAEIAMALTRHDLDDVIDHATLIGGPPMTEFDTFCKGKAADTSWPRECRSLWAAAGQSGQCPRLACSISERPMSNVARLMDRAFGRPGACSDPENLSGLDELRKAGVLFPGARLDFRSPVLFVAGSRDCTEAVVSGRQFHDLVRSAKVYVILEGVPHVIEESATGMDALADLLIENCN